MRACWRGCSLSTSRSSAPAGSGRGPPHDERRPLVVLHLAANRWWTGSADPVIRLVQGPAGARPSGHARPDRGRSLRGQGPRGGAASPSTASRSRRKVAPLGVLTDMRAPARASWSEHGSTSSTAITRTTTGWACLVPRPGGARPDLPQRALRERRLAGPRALPANRRRYRGEQRRSRRAAARIGAPDRVFRVDGVTDVARFGARREEGESVRKEFGLGSGPSIGSVSRLAPQPRPRGADSGLPRSCGHVTRRRGSLLVGKGEQRAPSRVSRPRPRTRLSRVLFTGYRDRDLPQVLEALDVFVLMGAGSDESCRAALEAMAAGRPVVARRVGAPPGRGRSTAAPGC